METFSVHAYVLKASSITASRWRIVLFAKNRGKVVVWASPRSVNRCFNYFEPFIEADWFLKERRESLDVREVRILSLPPSISPRVMVSAWYMNELLLYSLAEGEPDAELYGVYQHSLKELGDLPLDESGTQFSYHLEQILRRFEWKLLQSIGFGISLTHEAQRHEPIQPHLHYDCVVNKGFVIKESHSQNTPGIDGLDLLNLAHGRPLSQEGLKSMKIITRQLIDVALGHPILKTREMIKKMYGYSHE
jgi:DNA repair protein RecO (recombination protein O)